MSKETNKLQSLRKKNQRLEKVMAQDSSTVKEHAVILNDYRFFARVVGWLYYSYMTSMVKHNIKEVNKVAKSRTHKSTDNVWDKHDLKAMNNARKMSHKSLGPLHSAMNELNKVAQSSHMPKISNVKLIEANERTNRQLGRLVVEHHQELKRKHVKLTAQQVSDDNVYKLHYPKDAKEATQYLSLASHKYLGKRKDDNE